MSVPIRVAIACSSDIRDPRAFSGSPHGLARGVVDAGHLAVGIKAAPPRSALRLAEWLVGLKRVEIKRVHTRKELRVALKAALWRNCADRHLRQMKSLIARWNSRRIAPVDVCVQWGSDFELPGAVAYVTYDDQTVVQAARSYDYPWITNLSGTELDWLIETQRAVFLRARMCCASTHWCAQSLIDDYGIEPDRVRVVGIGANHTLHQAPARAWSAPRFLFVGIEWDRKNGQRILDAFRALRSDRPEARLDIVGHHPPIDQPNVTDHGFLDWARAEDRQTLSSLFATATCFVMPSLHEPAGIAYVEAAHAGIGSIGSTSGGAATLVGSAGLTVDPKDPAAILAAMASFCDPRVAARYGRIALERSKRFTWTAVAMRLIAAFHRVPPFDSLELDQPALQAG